MPSKRLILYIVALLLAASLAACGQRLTNIAPSKPPSTTSGASVAEPHTLPESIETPAPTSEPTSVSAPVASSSDSASNSLPSLLDPQLLSLLSETNEALSAFRSESVYAEITGMGAASLEFFSPYCKILFEPQDNPETVWKDSSGDALYEENPYQGELPIYEIRLCAELDPATPAVLNQESLRQLFLTDETITYNLLCQELRQTPELEHTEPVYYSPREPYSAPNWEQNAEICDGTYDASFTVNDLEIQCSFILQSSEYVCYLVFIHPL